MIVTHSQCMLERQLWKNPLYLNINPKKSSFVYCKPRQMIRTNADYCIILIETKRLKENVCPQIQWIENLYSVHYQKGLKHHRQWYMFYDKKEISMIMNLIHAFYYLQKKNKQWFEIDQLKMMNSKQRNHDLWINEPYLMWHIFYDKFKIKNSEIMIYESMSHT